MNNSGVYEFAPIEAVTEASFHKLFNINVLGLLLVTQAPPSTWCRWQHYQYRFGCEPSRNRKLGGLHRH